MYLLVGFIVGFFIPFIARRLGKILPATTGVLIYHLIHLPRIAHAHNPLQTKLLKKRWALLFANALFMSIITAALFALAHYLLPENAFVYATLFIWLILCAASVDARFFVLPDCLTIPLLLGGFLFSVMTPLITPQQCAYGALFAYTITILAVFVSAQMRYNIFGGGDSKMIIALGSWLGIEGINYTLLLSFFLFLIHSFWKKDKTGAYGPALSLAGLLCFFILYAK